MTSSPLYYICQIDQDSNKIFSMFKTIDAVGLDPNKFHAVCVL